MGGQEVEFETNARRSQAVDSEPTAERRMIDGHGDASRPDYAVPSDGRHSIDGTRKRLPVFSLID